MTYINNNKIISLGGIKRAYLNNTLIFQSFKKDEEVISPYGITAKFNVTSTTSPTKVCNKTSAITEMYVDGVQIDVASGYTFNTTGEHTVNYMLADKTKIVDSAFYVCRNLKYIDISKSVKTIGHNAFGYCSNLTEIVIPDGVETIGNNTFISCESLTSVTIPNSVKSIGPNAFYNCLIHIDNFINNSSATGYPWYAIIYDKIQDDGLYINGTTAVYCKKDATNVTIPESITSIGYIAFKECTSLSSITIPENVESIGDGAFGYCSSLTKITCLSTTAPTLNGTVFIGLPDSGTLTYPCESDYSTWLSELRWKDTCNQDTPEEDIPEEEASPYDITAKFDVTSTTSKTVLCFSAYTSAFTEMYVDGTQISPTSAYTFSSPGEHTVGYMLKDKTTLAGNMMNGHFKGCSRMTEIKFKDTLTSISGPSFSGCTSLQKVTFGSGLTSVGTSSGFLSYSIFTGCTSLTEITCLAPTAPTLLTKSIQGIENNGGVLYVPNGSDYSTWTSILTSWTIQYIT